MKQAKDISGQRFGHLVARTKTHITLSSGRKMPGWILDCDCGAEVTAMTVNLMKGKHRSCGCQKGALAAETAGYKGVTKLPEYRIYRQMIDRCHLESAKNFKWYGGRGIKVCDRWRHGSAGMTGFECFFSDMGPRPDGLTLDRKDVEGDYSPENCQWASWLTQGANRTDNALISANGETKTLSEWARQCGANPTTIRERIDRGWPVDVAVTTAPLKTWNRHVGKNYNRS